MEAAIQNMNGPPNERGRPVHDYNQHQSIPASANFVEMTLNSIGINLPPAAADVASMGGNATSAMNLHGKSASMREFRPSARDSSDSSDDCWRGGNNSNRRSGAQCDAVTAAIFPSAGIERVDARFGWQKRRP